MKNIFLIAPYNIDGQYIAKKKIINKLCNDLKIELLIAEDSITGTSLNALETLELIKQCEFAIADLSYERPSCYYEVGFMQALNKKVYLISESNTIIHQLLNKNNIKFYSNLIDYHYLIEEILRKEKIY